MWWGQGILSFSKNGKRKAEAERQTTLHHKEHQEYKVHKERQKLYCVFLYALRVFVYFVIGLKSLLLSAFRSFTKPRTE